MPKPKLYLETSVISYRAAPPSRDVVILGHQESTSEWWRESLPRFQVYISPMVLQEISLGNPEKAQARLALVERIPVLTASDEVEHLANFFMANLPLPEKAYGDTVHLAFACVHRIDFMATWNCAHLANAMIRQRLRKLIRQTNYDTPVIGTPEELTDIERSEP